jgi:hypothetical protein
MSTPRISLILALLIGSSGTAGAAPSAAPCGTADHRAFDFWVGKWNVRTPDGKLVGTNRIEREYGGCVVHEHYDTNRGYSGESLNIYDAERKVWHQSWVDSDGTLLVLEGGLREGKMILEGQLVGANGIASKQRITWTPNKDGSVRQLWESTNAKGEWTVAFDGMYTPWR